VVEFDFQFDDRAAQQRLGYVADAIRRGPDGPLRGLYKRLGVIMLAFTRARYLRAARGDGTWLPLSIRTIIERLRKTKVLEKRFARDKVKLAGALGRKVTNPEVAAVRLLQGSSVEILRDTGVLFNSLSTGSPGSVYRPAANAEGSEVTVGTAIHYARHHQAPEVPGRPPERLIFVKPDDQTISRMQGEFDRALDRIARGPGAEAPEGPE
jgi:hypothetical protein